MSRGLLLGLLVLTACPPTASLLTTGFGSSGETSASSTDGSTTGSSGAAGSSTAAGSGSGDMSSGSSTTGASTTTGDPPDTTADGSSGAGSFCGDGFVDASTEECDDGIDPVACFHCGRPRIVFATSEVFRPDKIGGLALADGICRQLAGAAGLPHWTTYVAWLSDSTADARDRVFPGKGRYFRTDGTLVGEGIEQFFSGELLAPIERDENNMVVTGSAWTGTRPDGTAVPDSGHCSNWTSGALQEKGAYGVPTEIDGAWTMHPNPIVNPGTCGNYGRLYCFEGK